MEVVEWLQDGRPNEVVELATGWLGVFKLLVKYGQKGEDHGKAD